jgi:hypothetical protein
MLPSELTDSLFPHMSPHGKICLRCQLESLRRNCVDLYVGSLFACSEPVKALLPHEILEWLGRPVSETDISKVLPAYRDLVVCEDWYMKSFSHVLNSYAYYARRYHPRGDVPDELIFAVGKMFVWQCDEIRFFDEKSKKEPHMYDVDGFVR